jgi:Domain of unknown function (DUF4136)
MKMPHILPVALGLFLAACTPFQVHYDYDSRAAYSSYKTFDWYAASKYAKEKANGVENSLMDRRVRFSVEKELKTRGFSLETKGDPDFLVTYYPVYQDRVIQTATHVGGAWGYRPWWGVRTGTTVVRNRHYKEGTIILEIVDFKTNQLIWKAAAEGALTNLDNPEDADEVVARAVNQMLDRFPPHR